MEKEKNIIKKEIIMTVILIMIIKNVLGILTKMKIAYAIIRVS